MRHFDSEAVDSAAAATSRGTPAASPAAAAADALSACPGPGGGRGGRVLLHPSAAIPLPGICKGRARLAAAAGPVTAEHQDATRSAVIDDGRTLTNWCIRTAGRIAPGLAVPNPQRVRARTVREHDGVVQHKLAHGGVVNSGRRRGPA